MAARKALLPGDETRTRTGDSRSEHYRKLKRGEIPPPIVLGVRARRYVESEIDAVVSARISGASPEEIRALVARLVAARSQKHGVA